MSDTQNNGVEISMDDIKEFHGDYYHAMGRFIDRFGQTERSLGLKLSMICGISVDDAQILFFNLSLHQKINTIKSLIKVRNVPSSDLATLEQGLNHLKKIAELRNSLVHYGARFDPNTPHERVTSKDRSALKPEPQKFTISAEMLLNLYHDLEKIDAHMDAGLRAVIPAIVWGDPVSEKLQRQWLYNFSD